MTDDPLPDDPLERFLDALDSDAGYALVKILEAGMEPFPDERAALNAALEATRTWPRAIAYEVRVRGETLTVHPDDVQIITG